VSSRIEDMPRGQAERLIPLMLECLAEAGLTLKDLTAIAVGRGPGNFTGIRISVSAARGLSLSLGIPAIGVTGFEALRGPDLFSDKAPQIVSLPSNRPGHDLMIQYFEGAEPVGHPLELALGGRISSLAPAGTHILGCAASALDFAINERETGSVELQFADSEELRQVNRIASVAALKLQSGQDLPRPSPLYIRPADAAPPREGPPVILP